MGFMDLSIGGSDKAFDFTFSADEMLYAAIKTELSRKHSEYNTPAVINVALYFEERIKSTESSEELTEILKKIIEALEEIIPSWPEEKKRLKEILKALKKIPQFCKEES